MPTILEQYTQAFAKDQLLTQRAGQLFPDGLTSDSRYMQPFPIHIDHAEGAKKWSVSGKELIDYWAGHGALLLGHNPPEVVAAVTRQIQRGTHFSACHPYASEWAKLVIELIPSAERVRFTASGTEANLLALQLARAYTGKHKLLRFAGHYHGWPDALMLGSDLAAETRDRAIPPEVIEQTLVCPPNDIEAVEQYLSADSEIACVILEPTGASSGVIPSNGHFLRQLRALTQAYGVLLIFDEIVTGFRIAPGGAQAHYQVMPDITTLAKVLAGGLPGGAVAGKREILDRLSFVESPNKKVPHLGTFNGNPLSAVAGVAMLNRVKTGQPQKKVNHLAQTLREGLNTIIDQQRLDWVVYGEFSSLKFFIGHGESNLRTTDFDPYQWNYRQLMQRGNTQLYLSLRLGMLLNGVDISLSSAMTTAHSYEDIQKTLMAFEQTIALMKQDKQIRN